MICKICGEQVRFGYRAGYGWLHRENKDHAGDPMVAPEGERAPEIPDPELVWGEVEPNTRMFVGTPDGPVLIEVPGGARTIVNLAKKSGWELRRLTYSRGPYLGSKGEVLSISDSIVLGARSPSEGCNPGRIAVASWRDGKFDFGYVSVIENDTLHPRKVNATELKAWIREDQTQGADRPGCSEPGLDPGSGHLPDARSV